MTIINEKIDFEKKVQNILKLYNIGSFEDVISRTKPLIKKYPHIIDLYNLLALSYNGLNKTEEAIKLLEDVLKKNPNNIHILNNLGMIHSGISSFEPSKIFLEKALKIKPDFFQAANNLANLLLKLNKAEEAIELLKKFINQEYSNNYVLNFTIANSYQQSGDFKNARKHYDKCLLIEPNRCDSDKAISLMTNYKNDKSNHLQNMEKKITKDLNKTDLMLLNYSIGKAYEDINNYEKSFIYLKKANDLNNELINYNPSNEKKTFENIKIIFKNHFNAINKDYNSDKIVIFIVGMPRSGTSLIEQILSSNENVYGAGELPFIGNLAENLFFKDKVKLNHNSLEEIGEDKLNKLNSDYFKKLSSFGVKKKIFIDKAPFNFKWIGLIKKVIPNSKIIHCRRDSMDICWSNYKNFFSSIKMNYSNNFKNIAYFYNLYLDIMNFWKNKLTKEIYDIDYENLIKNPEKEIKNLVSFCELDWNESYLKFYENKKTVSTASLAQVRSPLYKSSIKKWENYGEKLNELKKLIDY
tara:strand:+ start:21 stop:1595 length:1575 start_codon:yes stop_codon:yes gene_type:complete